MSIFSKQNKTEQDQRFRRRYEIARSIYSAIINKGNRAAITHQQYNDLPHTAAKEAVRFADALLAELEKED